MNVLKKLKLNSIDRMELKKREMNTIRGGNNCTCGCHYANSGGASSGDNDAANYTNNYKSYGGGSQSCGPCTGTTIATLSDFWKGYL